MSVRSPPARTRLTPAERTQQIVDAAAEIIVEQGVFPISFETLSQRVGVSKGLIYSYFPNPYDLAAGILSRHLPPLLEVAPAAGAENDEAIALDWADRYFDHVAARGPLLHILLGDPQVAARLTPDVRPLYDRTMGRLARALRAARGLTSREAVAALNILASIPEELGNLVFLKQTGVDLARQMCREMLLGGLEGLRTLSRTSPHPAPQGRSAPHP